MNNYVKRLFINRPNSISTGTLCAFDGLQSERTNVHKTFLEFGDCHNKIRIFQSSTESKDAYIKKITKLRNALDDFNYHLMNNMENVKETFVKRIWLCDDNSTGTESIVTFDGKHNTYTPNRLTFMEVSDTIKKIRFHRVHDDTIKDTVDKHNKIMLFINEFVNYLSR